MSAAWRVELSTDAAAQVRESTPVVRGRIASALDRMETEGVPVTARPDGPNRAVLAVGSSELVLVVNAREQQILVVRIDGLDGDTPAREALRAAHVPARASRNIGRWIDELTLDVRSAFRGLRRAPGFSLAVLATLTIAIGGTTSLAGLATKVFRGALPFEDDHELLRLRDRRVTPGGDPRVFNMSPLNFSTLKAEASTLEGVVAMGGTNIILRGDDGAERVNAIRVSEGWASLLGLEPVLGRVFTEDEEQAGPDAGVALLTHGLWQNRFGGDPSVVGNTIQSDVGPLTVIGVMPPRFRYPYDADLWIPGRWDPSNGNAHDLNVAGRMAEGATLEAVRAELDRIALTLQDQRPDSNADLFHNAETLRADFIRQEDQVLIALTAAVAFLLLLACVNVTNLLIARFVGRRREVGIRVALGAGRVREVRAFVVESLLLFGAGGLAGVLLATWLGGTMSVLLPDVMRTQLDMEGLALSLPLLGLSMGIALLSGLVFGLFAAVRGSDVGALEALRGGRGFSRKAGRGQDALVVLQLALSLSLLVGAGVLFGHFQRLRSDDLGMQLDGLYTLRISLEHDRFAEADSRMGAVTGLTQAMESLSGVEQVAYTTVNPLCCGDWGAPLGVEDRPNPGGGTHMIHHRLVGPDYFEATGTPILRGRDFGPMDTPEAPPTVIVDQALADRFWPGEDALGKRIRIDRPENEWRTIVGVVGDVEESGDYSETWYLPYTQLPTSRSTENVHFMVRSPAGRGIDEIRRAVGQFDPELAVYSMTSMPELRRQNLTRDAFGASMGSGFAAFGLLLAGLGVFGMLSYSVTTRSRELSTRVALGARSSEIAGLVLVRSGRIAAAGTVAGVLLAYALNKILQRVVFGVETASPLLIAGLSAVLAATAFVAAAAPALRASRVDPIQALRE